MAESSNTTTSTRDPNIFYESTPDGDIRIIDQNNNHKTDNNNSAGDGGNELFQQTSFTYKKVNFKEIAESSRR